MAAADGEEERRPLEPLELCAGSGVYVSTARPLERIWDTKWLPTCPECGGWFLPGSTLYVAVPPHLPVR